MLGTGHAKIMILATDGFEQSELEVPLKTLSAAGAAVDVVSPREGEITGWDKKDWGSAFCDAIIDAVEQSGRQRVAAE